MSTTANTDAPRNAAGRVLVRKAAFTPERRALTLAQVAEIRGEHPDTTRRRLKADPTFPRPFHITPDGRPRIGKDGLQKAALRFDAREIHEHYDASIAASREAAG